MRCHSCWLGIIAGCHRYSSDANMYTQYNNRMEDKSTHLANTHPWHELHRVKAGDGFEFRARASPGLIRKHTGSTASVCA